MVLIKNFLETVDNKADNFDDIDDINSVSLKIYKGDVEKYWKSIFFGSSSLIQEVIM